MLGGQSREGRFRQDGPGRGTGGRLRTMVVCGRGGGGQAVAGGDMRALSWIQITGASFLRVKELLSCSPCWCAIEGF